ncbi:S8 family peptidase [Pseudoduganella lutea]|uniref:S8 family peptidase n=1 Tax=Pseudoduganella lutea TaxID=321985 RepID=A0A4P6L274_9BURK|nr:S8 family peptidase [Pseudoduganella lutea]QBE65676.1 S8 family peptidase [Pseudoduganella lutea]
MKRAWLPLLVLALGALPAAESLAQKAKPVRRAYIVHLAEKPAASYEGTIAGLRATRPAIGAKLDPRSTSVARYAGFLKQRQASVLSAFRGAKVLHSYQLVYNGFSALLTDSEAKALRKTSGVLAVMLETPRKLDTHYTPAYLNLDGPGGVWSQLGGSDKAGEDVIIGVIDTGIWPEHPAFADRVDAEGRPSTDPAATLAYGPAPARWKGSCQAGEGFTASHCNNKLIGARFYNEALLAQGFDIYWSEFRSPRDGLAVEPRSGFGHGTHTASTAAGNHNTLPTLDGVPVSAASGIAPRARVAAYKVCWSFSQAGSPDVMEATCMPGDSVAAVEQAVADGVDVLNFSIGGYLTVDDPVDQAFLGAASAGVFVAASAGNSAPYMSAAHLVPWVTTTAAASHDKSTGAELQVTDGPRFVGGSLNKASLPPTPFVLARHAGLVPFEELNGTDQGARATCASPEEAAQQGAGAAAAIEPARVAGKVLVCEGGLTSPLAKSVAVKGYGAAAMVLAEYDKGPSYVQYAVPTVDLVLEDGIALGEYLMAHPEATLSMSAFGLHENPAAAPMVTSFSSRGPNIAAPGVMKPDLAAPGLEILAGTTPGGDQATFDRIAASGATQADTRWRFHTGTSMASPHVAGLAALLRQQHPDWSPAAIKSAMMTTAHQTQDDGQAGTGNGKLPWGQGAGLMQPALAVDPGLVYDADTRDWQRFLCGLEAASILASDCASIGRVADTDLNQPALTVPAIGDTEVVTRTVTNVGDAPATYSATADLPGFDVSVAPAQLSLAPGEKGTFSVTLKRTTAPNLAWQYGSLVWSDGTHRVRSPLQAYTMAFNAPDWIQEPIPSGKKLFPIQSGSGARVKVEISGLVEAQRDILSLRGASGPDYGLAECLAGGSERVAIKKFTVPEGTLGFRFGAFSSDSSSMPDGIDFLTLLVIDPHRQLAGMGSWMYSPTVSTSNPEPGEYTICVSSEGPRDPNGIQFVLSSWIIAPGQDAGNVHVTLPARLNKDGTGTVALAWNGLDNTKRYFGMASFIIDGRTEKLTELFIDAERPEGLPLVPGRILKQPPQANPRRGPVKGARWPGGTTATGQ